MGKTKPRIGSLQASLAGQAKGGVGDEQVRASVLHPRRTCRKPWLYGGLTEKTSRARPSARLRPELLADLLR